VVRKARVDRVRALIIVDVQNERATIFAGYGSGYPNAVPNNVTQLYDISKLEEMHR